VRSACFAGAVQDANIVDVAAAEVDLNVDGHAQATTYSNRTTVQEEEPEV